jgi:hypothetical protein
VHGGLEILVAFPITIGLFNDDAALEQQLFEDFENVELGVAGVSLKALDCVIGRRRITIQASPSILAKPIRFKPPSCKRLRSAAPVK